MSRMLDKPSSGASHQFEFANVFVSGHSNVNHAYTWEHFDFPFWRLWMSQNFHLSILCALLYISFLFIGRRWMAYRHPYKLKSPLVLWNIGFVVFSLAAFCRTFPDLWMTVMDRQDDVDGFYKSVCSSDGLTIQFAFWSWVGSISKIAELGDTVFIVLRKQPLLFLHWYHHASAMIYTWFTFPEQEPCHRWLMTMNFFVHILMYTYFALRAGGIKLPRYLAMCITSLQIFQMIIGIYINWYTWRELGSRRGCERHQFNLIVAAIMYTSYLVLFAIFFYNAYFKSTKRKTE